MPGLGERAREVLEQPGAVPGVDLQLDAEGGLVVALPRDLGEALGVLLQRRDVLAVLAVDRDAAAERDVADDLVAGHRPAALGQPHHHVVDALDLDAVAGRGAGGRVRSSLPRARPSPGCSSATASPCLSRWSSLLTTTARRDLRLAQRDVEVVGLPEAHLADHVREQRRAGDLLRRQALLAQRLLEQLAPAVLGVLAALAREPGADLVAGAGGLDQRQPVARRARAPAWR